MVNVAENSLRSWTKSEVVDDTTADVWVTVAVTEAAVGSRFIGLCCLDRIETMDPRGVFRLAGDTAIGEHS